MSEKEYDVIIIGSGIGGLTLGALLANRNKKILLIEKHKNIGGYCSSFKRSDFIFDSSLHVVNGCYKDGSVYNILKKCDTINRLNFLQPKYLCRSIFPDYDIRIPQNDYKKFIDILSEIFPKQKDGLICFFEKAIKIFNEIRELETQKKISKDSIILKHSNKSTKSILDNFIEDKKLKAILSQYWVYCGLPPSKLSSLYYCYIWGDLILNGGYYPEGGSQSLCDFLAGGIRMKNNLILTNKTVKKILVDDNCAIGVVADKDEIYYAKKIVSNIDAKFTINHLLNGYNFPTQYKKIINNTKVSISAYKVYLGIDRDVNNVDYEIFINPSYDLDEQYEASIKNIAKKAPLGVTIYTNLLKKERNKSVISLTILSGYDYWKSKSNHEYKKAKFAIADELLKRVDKILPNLIKNIKVMEIATPLTMERYTGNFKGAIYGWMKEERRNSLKKINQITPIKNLYLTSNWTRKGGGISGVMRSSEVVDRLLK